MLYDRRITSAQIGCILILIDQSQSMGGLFGGDKKYKKCDVVADSTNKIIHTLTIQCCDIKKETAQIKYYFDVGVIGYGGPNGVCSAFTNRQLSTRELIPIPEIADNAYVEERQKKVPDGTGDLVEVTEQFPFWFKAVAHNGTPMCEALQKTKRILNDWISQHMESFPPIVINITDGEVTDGSIQEMIDNGNAIKDLSTNDGNVLFFNVHVSSSNVQGILFPATANDIPDEYGRALFEMSSPLTDDMRERAKKVSGNYQTLTPGCKGCGFNTDFEQFVNFLKIGTYTKSPGEQIIKERNQEKVDST